MTRKKTYDFSKAAHAEGLDPEHSALIARLAKVYSDNRCKNALRRRYYRDKTRPKNLGEDLPPRFRNMKVSVGWAAKSVDSLAARSILNGFTVDGEYKDALHAIFEENDMQMLYEMALPPELVHGCGFWTVVPDEDIVLPGELVGTGVRFHDAESSAALWDYAHRCVKAGIVVEDVDEVGGVVQPTCFNLYTRDRVIELSLVGGVWSMTRNIEHNVGRCLMEPMCYRPSTYRPFGKSRVSPTVMTITDDMQRAVINVALHDEMHASPMKYMLNVSEKQFNAMMSEEGKWTWKKFLVATSGASGTPDVGMLQASSPDGHIAYMEYLARRMAAESCLPIAAFGVQGNGYTSSDALRASSDELIIEAESLNRSNGRAMKNVALMALAVANDVPLSELPYEARQITVKFADPAMTTAAAMSDAMLKQVSFLGEGFAKSEVCLEQLGYDDDQVRRIKSDIRSDQARQMITMLEDGADGNAIT